MTADDALRATIKELHGCESTQVGSEPIHEDFEGKGTWQGTVYLFTLAGHSHARQCYAWEEPARPARGGMGRNPVRRFAVLKVDPIGSARDAVRASILERTGTKGAEHSGTAD